jgi:hypothetical protein
MKDIKKVLTYGVFVWLIPFLFFIITKPLNKTMSYFVDSGFVLCVVIVAVVFSILYFKKIYNQSIKESAMVGGIWYAMTFVLSFLTYFFGTKIIFLRYVLEYGVLFLIIPAIVVGFGFFIDKRDLT